MKTLSGLDGAFLHLETPETPMHVGSLCLLDLPRSYKGDFLRDVKRLYARRVPLLPVLGRTLVELPLGLANPAWVQAESVDLDHHIRRIVLPKPGSRAQLEACVGRLHSALLDRSRPLWMVYIIEGLQNRQVGYYTCIHHAVIDGQSGVELAKALFDTTARGRRNVRTASRPVGEGGEHPWLGALVVGALRHDAAQLTKFLRKLPEITQTLAKLRRTRRDIGRKDTNGPSTQVSLFAPRTRLNVAISGARTFAGVSVPLDEVHAVAAAHEATVNDVVLAICSGALRRYLGRRGGVPAESLVAAMPVSLRDPGNKEFTTLATMARVSLATDIADPVQRLHAIRDAASEAKEVTGRVKPILPTDFPTLGLPWLLHGLTALYTRTMRRRLMPPLINVVISNVPGPPVPLYFAGARIAEYWPISIVHHGMGVNITVESYAGALGFGVTAARDAMPQPRQFVRALLAAHEQLQHLSRRGRRRT